MYIYEHINPFAFTRPGDSPRRGAAVAAPSVSSSELGRRREKLTRVNKSFFIS